MSYDDERPMKAPKRCYEITITVGGDTWDDAIHEVLRLAYHAKDRGPECRCFCGGGHVGGSVEVRHDPNMTHERYIAELEEYLEMLRAYEAPLTTTPRPQGTPA